jgi:hypothetical protein
LPDNGSDNQGKKETKATMTILRLGTNEKYADGWSDIFGKSAAKKGQAGKKKSTAKKKPTTKKKPTVKRVAVKRSTTPAQKKTSKKVNAKKKS